MWAVGESAPQLMGLWGVNQDGRGAGATPCCSQPPSDPDRPRPSQGTADPATVWGHSEWRQLICQYDRSSPRQGVYFQEARLVAGSVTSAILRTFWRNTGTIIGGDGPDLPMEVLFSEVRGTVLKTHLVHRRFDFPDNNERTVRTDGWFKCDLARLHVLRDRMYGSRLCVAGFPDNQFASIDNFVMDVQLHSNDAELTHFCSKSDKDEGNVCRRVIDLDFSSHIQCLFHARESDHCNKWMPPVIDPPGLYPDAKASRQNRLFVIFVVTGCSSTRRGRDSFGWQGLPCDRR